MASHAANSSERLAQVLGSVADNQATRALTVLSRTAAGQVTEVVTLALLASLEGLVACCRAIPADEGTYRARIDLLDSLSRLGAQLFTPDLADALPADLQGRLSSTADELGQLAGDYGRVAEARALLSVALAADQARRAPIRTTPPTAKAWGSRTSASAPWTGPPGAPSRSATITRQPLRRARRAGRTTARLVAWPSRPS
jgi:hypothetical protein